MQIKRKKISFADLFKFNIREEYRPKSQPVDDNSTSKTIYGSIKALTEEIAHKAEETDFTEYKEEVNARLTSIESRLDALTAGNADNITMKSQLELLKAQGIVDRANLVLAKTNKTKEELTTQKAIIAETTATLNNIKAELKKKKQSTADVDAKIKELANITTNIDQAITSKDQEQQQLGNNKTQTITAATEAVNANQDVINNAANKSADELTTAKNNLQAKLDELLAIKQQLKAAGLDTADVDAKIAELEGLINKANTELANKNQAAQVAANEALKQTANTKITEADTAKNNANTVFTKPNATVNELTTAKNNLQSEIEKLKAEKNKLKAAGLDTTDIDNKIAELNGLKTNIDSKIVEIDKANETLRASVKNTITEADTAKNNANTLLGNKNASTDELNTVKTALQSKLDALKELKKQLEVAGLDTTEINAKIAELDAKIVELEGLVTKVDNKITGTPAQTHLWYGVAPNDTLTAAETANFTLLEPTSYFGPACEFVMNSKGTPNYGWVLIPESETALNSYITDTAWSIYHKEADGDYPFAEYQTTIEKNGIRYRAHRSENKTSGSATLRITKTETKPY